ncbi:uncharacterized protein LOC123692195 isoform X1 [Colias croceus]|uniref:uncharacterized protein LOC123692195 isoform X1 n=2 Tax=Colias crocea TaxID=72248 RepID=UPI001E2810E0|nr:uncharacterized protein LOC123692195 isoform X1 [Colias croceus]
MEDINMFKRSPTMEEESGCQLRKRRFAGNPNLALNLEVGYQVNEGCSSRGTPSPCHSKVAATPTSAQLRQEFRNKQQSFDLPVEDCEEIEIIIESDEEEGEKEENATAVIKVDRPITPTPVQDFGASVVYTEGPQAMDFLNVNAIEHDCYTDVSDADSDDEEEN